MWSPLVICLQEIMCIIFVTHETGRNLFNNPSVKGAQDVRSLHISVRMKTWNSLLQKQSIWASCSNRFIMERCNSCIWIFSRISNPWFWSKPTALLKRKTAELLEKCQHHSPIWKKSIDSQFQWCCCCSHSSSSC